MKTSYKTAKTLLANLGKRPPPVYVSGKDFARILRGATPTQLGLLADGLRRGSIIVTPMLAYQAAGLTGASSSYVSQAVRLTTAQRHNLEEGFYPLGRVVRQAREPDRTADRAVERFGAARLQAALDRALTPPAHPRSNGSTLPPHAAFER